MNPGPQLKRRSFIGAALLGAGGAVGWLSGKLQPSRGAQKSPADAPKNPFAYDVSEFEKTDPNLLRYEPAGQFTTGFERVKAIAAGPENSVWVAGDRFAKLFDARGRVQREILLERPPHCLCPAGSELFIGLGNSFEAYDSSGKRTVRSPRLGENAFLTAMAVHDSVVYLADAGGREILMCDRKSGALIDRFGQRDPTRNNPGLVVPSPYLDLAITSDGRLCVVNPGRLRVEFYSLDGRFESSWGEAGMQIDRFCGCCNPVHFALTPEGEFITSEKGLARINVYDRNGRYQGAVAGPEILVEDKELARRAQAENGAGGGFDVAVDEQGRVLTLDPYRKLVRYFAPLTKT